MPLQQTEPITRTLGWWLREEIAAADEGRNAYLSSFEARRADLLMPFDDQLNYPAQKAKAHHYRFQHWLDLYADNADARVDSRITARLIFACLMRASGCYRDQCFLEAEDANDYRRRRNESPLGIEVRPIVANEFEADQTSSMSEEEKITYIVARSIDINDESLAAHKDINVWLRSRQATRSGRLATPDDEPVRRICLAQKNWIGLAVAHIIVAGRLRGNNFARIPFLEPKSITDAKIIYPLAPGSNTPPRALLACKDNPLDGK